jgi:hypothetical protein
VHAPDLLIEGMSGLNDVLISYKIHHTDGLIPRAPVDTRGNEDALWETLRACGVHLTEVNHHRGRLAQYTRAGCCLLISGPMPVLGSPADHTAGEDTNQCG